MVLMISLINQGFLTSNENTGESPPLCRKTGIFKTNYFGDNNLCCWVADTIIENHRKSRKNYYNL